MTDKKTRKKRSAKRKTLSEEEYSRFKAMESYLSQPERFRKPYPPPELISSEEYDFKKLPGTQPSDPTKLKIFYCASVDPVFAKLIDDCLKKVKGNLSVKDPKISELRQKIIDTVPSLTGRDKTKVMEWLRDRHNRQKRRNKK